VTVPVVDLPAVTEPGLTVNDVNWSPVTVREVDLEEFLSDA